MAHITNRPGTGRFLGIRRKSKSHANSGLYMYFLLVELPMGSVIIMAIFCAVISRVLLKILVIGLPSVEYFFV